MKVKILSPVVVNPTFGSVSVSVEAELEKRNALMRLERQALKDSHTNQRALLEEEVRKRTFCVYNR